MKTERPSVSARGVRTTHDCSPTFLLYSLQSLCLRTHCLDVLSFCATPGPGKGVYGRPGQEGENCVPQGNVLIVQESDKADPDDNLMGGVICFAAAGDPIEVISVGLMGISRGMDYFIEATVENDIVPKRLDIDGLGTNSVQTVAIDLSNIRELCLFMPGGGAVTSVSVCGTDLPMQPTTSSPAASPPTALDTPVPTTTSMPTMTPEPSNPPMMTPMPSQSCSMPTTIDFGTSGDGMELNKGDYVGSEWSDKYGFIIEAISGCGGHTPDGKARIFDTSDPGTNQQNGDTDLGSPNR